MTQTKTMANGSYFQFDNDGKIEYTDSHNRHKRNGLAENAQPYQLHKT